MKLKTLSQTIIGIALIWLALALFAGCSLVPSERQRSESIKATESLAVEQEKTLRRSLEVVPEYGLTIPQDGTQVVSRPLIREDLSISTTTRTGAGSKSNSQGSSAVSIPLGVKIALVAFGLGLLWLVVWLWRRSSVAANAAYEAADRGIANVIGLFENAARTETDPVSLVKINAQLSALEKERGKLAR